MRRSGVGLERPMNTRWVMAGYCRRERKSSRTPPPSAAARTIAPPPNKSIERVLRVASPAGAGVGSAAARPGVPSNGCVVAAANTCGGGVAEGVNSSAGWTTLVATISGEGDAAGLAGAAGGSGVTAAGVAAALTGTAVGGRCGPPVGVLTTPDPIGAAVAGAGESGVGVDPGMAVTGRGVLANCRVAVGWSPDVAADTLVAVGVRVAVAPD